MSHWRIDFATSDNYNLYYGEKGEGRAVVFVCGWSCNRHFFKKQFPASREKYKVLCCDLRGYGNSDRPEKGLTLDQLTVPDLIPYGTSPPVGLGGLFTDPFKLICPP